jgi:hypothetical protein
MLTPEDFTSKKYRIYWPAILLIFVVQIIVLIALSIAVANHSSFETASSAATKVGLSVVDNRSDGSRGADKK